MRGTGDGSRGWIPATLVGDLDWVSIPQPPSWSILAQMLQTSGEDDFSLSFSLWIEFLKFSLNPCWTEPFFSLRWLSYLFTSHPLKSPIHSPLTFCVRLNLCYPNCGAHCLCFLVRFWESDWVGIWNDMTGNNGIYPGWLAAKWRSEKTKIQIMVERPGKVVTLGCPKVHAPTFCSF